MFGERLKLARARQGLSLRGLAAKIDHLVTAQAIGRYERNECIPSSPVFYKLVEALDIHSSFLSSIERFRVRSIQYRKNVWRKKKDAAKVEALITDSIERYWIVESFLGINSHAWDQWSGFNKPIFEFYEVDRAADDLRKLWCLGQGPIAQLDEVLESKGVKILKSELSKPDGLGARVFTADSNWLPIVLLKDRIPGERQRLALAHELGHFFLEPLEKLSSNKVANRFARALLLPTEALEQYIGKKRNYIGWGELFDLKRIFGVPVTALINRCKELQIFSQSFSKHLLTKCDEHGWLDGSSDEPECMPSLQISRFERMCSRSYAEERCSASRAGELLNIPSLQFVRRMDLPPNEIFSLKHALRPSFNNGF